MQELITQLEEKYPELMSRVQIGVIHDSLNVSCAPEDEVAIMEAVKAIQGRYNV